MNKNVHVNKIACSFKFNKKYKQFEINCNIYYKLIDISLKKENSTKTKLYLSRI